MRLCLNVLFIGDKVYKLLLLKRWDPTQKKLTYNRETRQLFLTKLDSSGKVGKLQNFVCAPKDLCVIIVLHIPFICHFMQIIFGIMHSITWIRLGVGTSCCVRKVTKEISRLIRVLKDKTEFDLATFYLFLHFPSIFFVLIQNTAVIKSKFNVWWAFLEVQYHYRHRNDFLSPNSEIFIHR